MSVRRLFVIMLTALGASLAGPAGPLVAADGTSVDLFTVHGISADVTASTAAAARRQALAEVQERAYQALVEKLVADTDIASLPPPSGELMESLVRAVDILEERRSTTRYLVVVDVAFRADAVRALFAQTGVAYTESMAGPYLLVPIFDDAGALRLFGEHPWRQALLAADWGNRLVRYLLPEDTARARGLLAPQSLVHAGARDLAPVATAFQVRQVALAIAQTGFDPETGRFLVRYQVRLGPEDAFEAEGEVLARDGEERAALLSRAADAALDRLDAQWKARTLIAGSALSHLTVRVPVRDLEDWLSVSNRLRAVSLVRAVEPATIGLPLSRFRIAFAGTTAQFRLALAQVGLELDGDGDGAVLRPIEQTPPQRSTPAQGEPP